MAKQAINLGTAPTGQGGDTPRSANVKIDANFDELYDALGAGGAPKVLPAALPVVKGGTGGSTPAAARSGLGLGDAATRNVGISPNQVMEVGAGGLLGIAPSTSNMHNVFNTEFRSAAVATNSPPGGDGYYNLMHIRAGVDSRWTTILAQEVNGYRLAFKTVAIDQSAATAWSTIYHSNNTTRAADGTLKAI
ncbi:hypothetical protein LU689_05570 [Pseudomonas asiatica]|uniref:hypothetical protein n=1 Tax=Pseudomonas asiatica TaxID=2219225 RepID=UPI001E5C1A2F|nr:hypothetical protein [Pseudomonas asiatica]MCE0849382.1 hypothetical protein [Pseudomonas asiatica]